MQKWIVIFTALALISSFVSCKSVRDDQQSLLLDADPVDQGELTIVEQWTLPVSELSGLAIGSYSDEKDVLIGVVDEKFEFVLLDVKVKNARPSILKIAGDSKNLRKKSKWEAIVYSGPQTLLALEEYPPSLEFVDTKTGQITSAINIDVDQMLNQQDENSFAEGIVLLKEGHALIAIEKNPLSIVEIGPKGDKPIGYKSDLVFGSMGAWQPREQKLHALKKWNISNKSEKYLSDLSDMTLDGKGHLYLLSDQSRLIARVESTLRPDEHKFNVREIWRLPGLISKAEGFVVYKDMFYVVSDTTGDGPNLFLLRP